MLITVTGEEGRILWWAFPPSPALPLQKSNWISHKKCLGLSFLLWEEQKGSEAPHSFGPLGLQEWDTLVCAIQKAASCVSGKRPYQEN
jgi:hypothetical protein